MKVRLRDDVHDEDKLNYFRQRILTTGINFCKDVYVLLLMQPPIRNHKTELRQPPSVFTYLHRRILPSPPPISNINKSLLLLIRHLHSG